MGGLGSGVFGWGLLGGESPEVRGINRGIVIYDVGGLPDYQGVLQPNPDLGITVELWNGKQISVMTIDEDSTFLAREWDSGFSEQSDMKVYPLKLSGSGGNINLVNNGWYREFLRAGYSFKGCRVARTWEGAVTEVNLSQSFVRSISSGVGMVSLSTAVLGDNLAKSISGTGEAGNPLIVGNWTGAKLTQAGEAEAKLFDGMTFRCVDYIKTKKDFCDVWIEITAEMVPSDATFAKTSYTIPKNSHCRIVTGIGEGQIFSIPEGQLTPGEVNNEGWTFSLALKNPYGVSVDDTNLDGFEIRIGNTSVPIGDVSVFEFFTIENRFSVDLQSTVSNVSSEGKNVSYVQDGGTIVVSNQFGGVQYFPSRWVPNRLAGDGLDMRTISPNLNGIGSAFYLAENNFISSYGLFPNTIGLNDPINDKNFETYSSVSGVEQVTMSWYIDNPEEEATGVSLFTRALFGDGTAQGSKPVYIGVSAVAEYMPRNDWKGTKRVETIMDRRAFYGNHSTDIETFYWSLGDQYLGADIKSLGQDLGFQNNPFDNRTNPSFTGGIQLMRRGTEVFDFENTTAMKSRPSRLYVNVCAMYIGSTGSPVDLRVMEMALHGKGGSPLDKISEVSADVTGRNWGAMSNAILQVAKMQNFDQFPPASDVDRFIIDSDNAPVRAFVKDKNLLKTDALLTQLLRESWMVGYIDRNGVYRARKVSHLIGANNSAPNSHRFYVPSGFTMEGSSITYDYDSTATGGTVQYCVDSEGKFQKSITISNADKETFLPEYVTGISNASTAESMWWRCRRIFLKTGVLTDIRSDQQKLFWLYNEADAINYFSGIIDWVGGGSFAREVITCSFEVAAMDTSTTGVLWNIGDYCRVNIPTLTDGDYGGVITGYSYIHGGKSGAPKAKVSVRVGQISPAGDRIIETGKTDPATKKIIELGGTAINRIIEIGVL